MNQANVDGPGSVDMGVAGPGRSTGKGRAETVGPLEKPPGEGVMVPTGERILGKGRKPKVVIVGGGFSGAYCAKTLEKLCGDECEILVVDRHNYFVFYPLLIEAGTGMLAPAHTVVSIRSYLKRSNFLMAEMESADFERKVIRVVPPDGKGREVEFDHLVFALGSVTKFPAIPGLKENAYEIKSVSQTVSLRDRAVQLLEQADTTDDLELKKRLLHFVVVGGSYTGVEVAGEYHAYLREAAKRYPRLDESMVRLTLIDRNDRILTTLPEELSRWATDHLKSRQGLDILLKNSITEAKEDGVRLETGEWLPCSTIIWAAGITAPPLLEKLGLPCERGWLMCEVDGRVRGRANIWGVGDAAVNPDEKGVGYPATAQHALQEGVECAKNIARVLKGQPTKRLVAKTRGTMAPLGRYDAVALVYGVKLKGILAWILWRGFYLTKVPGVGRGMHVLTDWASAIIFGRDFVEMGIHRTVRAAQQSGEDEHAAHTVPVGVVNVAPAVAQPAV